MNLEKLTGGAAVGAGVVIWATHGREFAVEEVVAMAAGLGAVITYLVSLIERALSAFEERNRT